MVAYLWQQYQMAAYLRVHMVNSLLAQDFEHYLEIHKKLLFCHHKTFVIRMDPHFLASLALAMADH